MQIQDLRRLKKKALISVFILFASIMIFRINMIINLYNQTKNEQKTTIFKQTSYIYNSKVGLISRYFTNRLNTMLSQKELIEAIKRRDKEKVFKFSYEKYKSIKLDFPMLKEMKFYLNDYKIFLKIGEGFNEKSDNIRSMIINSIETKKELMGFDSDNIENNQFIYKVVMPIIDSSKVLGAIEFGIDTRGILKQINSFFKSSLKESVYVGFLFKTKSSDVINPKVSNIVTNDKMLLTLIKNIDYSLSEQNIVYKDRDYFVFWGKDSLKDYNDKVVGTIIYAFDITNLEKRYKRNLIQSVIQPMFVMLLLYFSFLFLFNYIIKQSKLHNEKLIGVVDNQTSLIIVTNGIVIIQTNQSFLDFFDIKSTEEFLEKYTCVCEKFEEDDGYLKKEYGDKNWLEYILANPNINHKAKMKNKDGKPHIFQVNARAINQENSVEYVVSFEDITELEDINRNLSKIVSDKTRELQEINSKLEQKIEEAIKKIRQKDQQLFQQSRLAQMGEMISMIAHQWRQPLSAISAASASINLKAKLNKLDNETAIELSDKISGYSQHLSSTIDDFRDFFKTKKNKENTSYKEVIESVLGIVEISMKNKNIKLVKKLNSDLTFYTFPNELKQVVLNLLKNAEDVLIERDIKDPQIIIETNDNILSISDNGGGIPEDILDKIFDPYFSTKTKKDGTGLGLYMSKIIIEEHCGGKLRVKNSEIGAVFEIILPIEKA